MKIQSRTIRLVLSVTLLLVVAANVVFLFATLASGERIDQITSGVIPRHFIRQFDSDPLENYDGIHGIAHNSGDSLDKIASAVEAGAHGIEIDVIPYRGELYARHNQPLIVFGEFGFRPVLLEDAWAAAETEVIQLDLKAISPVFLRDVSAFLERHQDDGRIALVSSWDVETLRYFQDRNPEVGRLLSIGTLTAYDDLRGSIDSLQESDLLNGVTVFHELLDLTSVRWLDEHDLLVFAWTVESLSRVNELTMLGVDAVVTDNLSILNLLRERRQIEEVATPIADLATPAGHDPAQTESQ